MIGGISPDKAERIISEPRDETPEDHELTRQWKKFFLIFGIATVLAVVLLVVRLTASDVNWWKSLYILEALFVQ